MEEKGNITKYLFELLRQGAISANLNTLDRLGNSDDGVWNENYGCLKDAVSMLDAYRTIDLVLQEDDRSRMYGNCSGSGVFDCKQLVDRWKSIPQSDAFPKRIVISFFYEDHAKVKHDVEIIGEIGYNRTFSNFDGEDEDDYTMTTMVYIDGKPQTSRGTDPVSILSYTREVVMNEPKYDYDECSNDFVKMVEYILNDSSVRYYLLENNIVLHYRLGPIYNSKTHNVDTDNIEIGYDYSYKSNRHCNYTYTDAVIRTIAYAIERLIKSDYITGALNTLYSDMYSDAEDDTKDNVSEMTTGGGSIRFYTPDIYSDAYNKALKNIIDSCSTIIADVVEGVDDTSSINVTKFFNNDWDATWFKYTSMTQNTHERWESTKFAKCAIFYSQLYSSDSEDCRDFCTISAYMGRFLDRRGIRKDMIFVDIDSGLLGYRSYIFEDPDCCSDQLFSIQHCYKDIDTLLARIIYDTDVDGNCIWKDINSVGCNKIDICTVQNMGRTNYDRYQYIIADADRRAKCIKTTTLKEGELVSEKEGGNA